MIMRAGRTSKVQLAEHLDALARAYRLQLAATRARRAIAIGLSIDVILLLAARQALLSVQPHVLAILPILIAVVAVGAALIGRLNIPFLARQTDRTLGLQERLTTAVELARHQSDHASIPHQFAAQQLADTLAHLERFRPSAAFPFHIDRRELILLALPLLTMLAIIVLPQPRHEDKAELALVQEVIKQEAERVTVLADGLDAESNNADPQTRATIAKALEDLTKGLERPADSAEGAVAAIAEAEAKLAALQNPHADDLRQAIARAADSLRRDGATADAGASMAKSDGAAAADAMNSLGSKVNTMTSAQRSNTAQALRSAGASAARFDSRLGESLRRAGEALASSDPSLAPLLEKAAEDIRQASVQTANQDALEQALAQLETSRGTIGKSAQSSSAERGQARSPSSTTRPDSIAEARANPTSRGANPNGSPANPSAAADSQSSDGNQDTARNGEGQGESGSAAGRGTLNRSTRVFAPDALRSRQEQDSAPGFDRPTVSGSDASSLPAVGEASVDYSEVYAAYRDRATAATHDRYIPLDLKGLVKDYFSSLDPVTSPNSSER